MEWSEMPGAAGATKGWAAGIWLIDQLSSAHHIQVAEGPRAQREAPSRGGLDASNGRLSCFLLRTTLQVAFEGKSDNRSLAGFSGVRSLRSRFGLRPGQKPIRNWC